MCQIPIETGIIDSMTDSLNPVEKVVVISMGGTIEKVYDERDGALKNRGSAIKEKIDARLRLPYTDLRVFSLLAKDSSEMTGEDRALLGSFIASMLKEGCPVVVLHGTDTMVLSAEHCLEALPSLRVPVVFTGAMRPLGLEDSDALQNVAEAVMAARLIDPGVYISFHGRLFAVPGVRKNRERMTFERV